VPHVGNWRDKFFKEREGKYRVENNTEMKLGEVHYSKTGFHVVPYIKKE
ncbi:polymorphic toxin type 50 domain-containing protein, partial [Staphylococcus aureus]